ncbi:HAMP domain-containing histidine kinase [Streptomyces sp. ICN441]|uniref:histidine kinase n=1 Tax=Streptomyces tirandamycinicus TaxID=2174846 RepID=A0A2S1STY1_9ACTN|nr:MULTISPECIES: HAMP domain-containing sensor histidine kinase [Streptomyces]AWI29846.1 two-component sensor histidine kinase [Streptomyces tirandamycinicus]NNJ08154.1 HAMP domain-containing histidine kinase [Streptomyces sp. PKU-MA01144]TFE57089.1 HAMP domain-containing histidine kinase [Streptomyces sp. ICN441]
MSGGWSLRTRLVVSAVALIAVVAAVIGTVTTLALRTYLYGQKDEQLQGVAQRAAGPPPGEPGGGPRSPGSLRFVTGGGAPLGTVGVQVMVDGSLGDGAVSVQQESDALGPRVMDRPLTGAERAALTAVPRDLEPHTVEVPGLGDYRVEYRLGANGAFLVGVPLAEVHSTLGTLVVVEVCVTAAGLAAAGLAGGTIVGVALRPLRRVAATATRVSELPLHSGEVALHERVPEAEADPGTEVGRVGAALNRMLDHVHSALHARQESETRVRQFVADAGHELRTPLASIRGYAELTRRGRERPGPDTRHALARIESEATRMTGLVEDLLLLARLDAGRPLAYRSTDLSPLVVDAVSDARAAGPDHVWRLDLPDDPAVVRADPERLHQVLVNLLANARTHTPPGTTVTAAVRTSQCRSAVVLEVRDDGPGIPPGLLPYVFERFARGDASRSRHAGSTGLGLAIVHAVVTAHGGTVDVASTPGHTVFSVRLALVPEPGDSQTAHSAGTRP